MRSEGRGAGTGTSEATDTAISPESREERKKKGRISSCQHSGTRDPRQQGITHGIWYAVQYSPVWEREPLPIFIPHV